MLSEETQYQITVANYLDYRGLLYNASAGGMNSTKVQGGIHKAMGCKKGFPDLMIFEPTKDAVGVAIEMKSRKGYARPEQKKWLSDLEAKGWKAKVCKGSKEAIDFIEENYGK